MLRRLRRILTLRAFLKDKRGVSAVEFALIAPVLIMAYLGMTELTLGMIASRHTSHLAATIGDLASQSDTLTDANVSDLWSIGASMLQPFDTGTNLKIRLTEVMMNSSNQAIVQWSDASNMAAYTKNQVLSGITTSQVAVNNYLVMTEVEYDYASPIGDFLPGTTAMKDVFYHHPRNGASISRVSS